MFAQMSDNAKRSAAEVIGTFCLVFAGTGAIIINDISGGKVTHVGISLTSAWWSCLPPTTYASSTTFILKALASSWTGSFRSP